MGGLPFRTEPTEDAGAATASWYRFQYCCAAARLLAAVAAGKDCAVVCEWHEDFLFLMDGSVEAVSIKQRDETQPQWSLASLVSDGNLQHLFDTFERSDRLADCSLETNRAHRVGELWAEDQGICATARDDLAERLGIDGEPVQAFLEKFRIDASLPSAQHIASTYASEFAAPALDQLELSYDPIAAMRIASDLIANASRDQLSAETRRDLLMAKPSERNEVLIERKIDDRQVTTDEVREALADGARDRVPRLSSPPSEVKVPPETTLTKKLKKGELGPSVLEAAGRRRALWYVHRARYRDIDHREEELASLQEWVQDQANLAESEVTVTEPYGKEMFALLTKRLRNPGELPSGTRAEDRDPALLSGAAFELTDQCLIWWSLPFPIEDADANA